MSEVKMVETTISKRWKLMLPEHRAARGEVWDTWEAERMASMHEHLTTGDVVYDIGAEEGDMPALWASWGCQVALFEPNPRVWPNMRVIWEANGIPEPLAFYVGFAGATDTAAAYQALAGTGWFDEWPPCSYGKVIGDHGFLNLSERPDVPVVTLNTAATQTVPPTALTIDVEGAELEVLKGAAALVLAKYKPKVWVSIHPEFMERMYGSKPSQIHHLMERHGYIGTMLADDHEQHYLYLPNEEGNNQHGIDAGETAA